MSWRQLVGAIVVFFVVLIALAFVSEHLRSDRVDAAYSEVEALKSEYLRKKAMALHLDAYREQRRELDRMLGATLVRLPDKSDRTFAGVRSAAKARGLRLDVLAAGKADWRRDFHAQTPARIVVTGRYHQVGAFIADVGRLPASMRIEPFVIERSPQPGMVTLKGVLLAYRYLSDEEVGAQRKAAAKP